MPTMIALPAGLQRMLRMIGQSWRSIYASAIAQFSANCWQRRQASMEAVDQPRVEVRSAAPMEFLQCLERGTHRLIRPIRGDHHLKGVGNGDDARSERNSL